MSTKQDFWHGDCVLRLIQRPSSARHTKQSTFHQGGCTAPFKLMRGSNDGDGRLEIPLLHTAGGLVGGDLLSIKINGERGSSGLITTAAAQKVYGSIGLSTLYPKGKWAKQDCRFELNEKADLEWLPQELVLFGNGLFEQTMRVELCSDSSFLSTEIVRLGRTAAGEKLGEGIWRSRLEICRNIDQQKKRWEFIDQLELGGRALSSDHGMSNNPVFGSLIWAAPSSVSKELLNDLVQNALNARTGLDGHMSCSAIDHGLSARFLGASSQAARFWFLRIWSETRYLRNLSRPTSLRVWPMQEDPFSRNHVKGEQT